MRSGDKSPVRSNASGKLCDSNSNNYNNYNNSNVIIYIMIIVIIYIMIIVIIYTNNYHDFDNTAMNKNK